MMYLIQDKVDKGYLILNDNTIEWSGNRFNDPSDWDGSMINDTSKALAKSIDDWLLKCPKSRIILQHENLTPEILQQHPELFI